MATSPYPGDQATRQQIAQWMASHARAAGLPPELPVMAGLVESGLRNLNYGDRDSLGFFQMRKGIWDQGAYKGYATNPELQMRWFIDTALKANRGANLGEWVANIERPAEQYRGRYQQRLAEARALVGQAMASPATGVAPSLPSAGPALGAPTTTTANLQTPNRFARFNAIQPLLAQNAKMAGVPEIRIPESMQLRVEMDDATTDTTLPTAPAERQAPAPDAQPGRLVGGDYQLIGTPRSGTHTLGNWQSDNALDLSVPEGTPIYAADDGVIGDRFGSLGKGGRFAGLRMTVQSQANAYYYAHLSRFAEGIKPGTRVRKGQLLGYSGSANGVPHLHFGVQNGDPRTYAG